MLAKQIIDIVPWGKKTKPTLVELKAILKKEGLESELYSDPPRMKYGRHKHEAMTASYLKPTNPASRRSGSLSRSSKWNRRTKRQMNR